MAEQSSLISSPVAVPFYKGEISKVFPVLQDASAGIVYDGANMAIAKIIKDDLELDEFPNTEDFSAYSADQFFQSNPDTLFIKDRKFLNMIDWKNKKLISSFCDRSKSIDINLEKSKIVDFQKGIAISLFFFFPDDHFDQTAQYLFVLDDIVNKNRLKELSISSPENDFPVFFTPSYIVYRTNDKESWKVLDNNLKETTFPLIDLLKTYEKDSIFFAFNKCVYISEPDKSALIIARNQLLEKDMLFLATWYNEPGIQSIAIDSAVLGSRRLVTFPEKNSMSPSGRWVYFCAEGEGMEQDAHFLIYLDPRLPNGYLPPIRLGLEGRIGCAGWVKNPEQFVVYKNNQLLMYDLSKFDLERFLNK